MNLGIHPLLYHTCEEESFSWPKLDLLIPTEHHWNAITLWQSELLHDAIDEIVK